MIQNIFNRKPTLAVWMFSMVAVGLAQGNLENTSVINADGTGDYLSLHQAFTALSGSFTGTVPNHTLLVASDLTETQPLVLARSSGASKLTIKPVGQPRVINVICPPPINTFNRNDIHGIAWNAASISPPRVCNAVIDGTLDGADYGLTFNFSLNDEVTSSYQAHQGFYFGGNGTVEIRNCRIDHNPETESQSYAVVIDTVNDREVVIENNLINALPQWTSGIVSDYGSTVSSTPSYVTIRNNIINSSTHGISIYDRDAIIDGNEINVTGSPQSYISLLGIVVNRRAAATTSTIVSNNRIVIKGGESATVVQGIRAVSGLDHGGLLRIFNNMVSLNINTGVESRAVRGITAVNRRAAVSEVAHNSVFLPANQINNEELNRNFHALGLDAVSSNSVTFANNILRVGSRWGTAMFYQSGNNVLSDGNVIGVTGEAVAVTTEATTYTLLADWQTASGTDMASQVFDPLPSWASPDDLHLVNSTSGLQPGVSNLLSTPITLDIDGDPRNVTAPTPGADEVDLAARIGEWSVY